MTKLNMSKVLVNNNPMRFNNQFSDVSNLCYGVSRTWFNRCWEFSSAKISARRNYALRQCKTNGRRNLHWEVKIWSLIVTECIYALVEVIRSIRYIS